MVEPHLLVAVRFPPTREGSGTKGSGRRPKNRAFFQVSLQYVCSIAVFLLGCSGTLWLYLLSAHLEQFVRVLEPQVVEEIVQFIPQELFSKFFID